VENGGAAAKEDAEDNPIYMRLANQAFELFGSAHEKVSMLVTEAGGMDHQFAEEAPVDHQFVEEAPVDDEANNRMEWRLLSKPGIWFLVFLLPQILFCRRLHSTAVDSLGRFTTASAKKTKAVERIGMMRRR
jgi:hypothetical protein